MMKGFLFIIAAAMAAGASAQALDFIDTESNHIIMNGDNWARLRS